MFLDKNLACLEITELMQLILLNASQSEVCPPSVVSTRGQKQKTDRTGDYTETRRLHKRIPLCTGTLRYNLKTSPDSLRD